MGACMFAFIRETTSRCW